MKQLVAIFFLSLLTLAFAQTERYDYSFKAQFTTQPTPFHFSKKMLMCFVRTNQGNLASFIPVEQGNGDILLENFVLLVGGSPSGPVQNILLPRSYTIDFDTQRVGVADGSEDLWYHVLQNGDAYLVPQHGAELGDVPMHALSLPMAAFQRAYNSNTLTIDPVWMEDRQSDWAAMAAVILPPNANILRIEADYTDNGGLLRVDLMADKGLNGGLALVGRCETTSPGSGQRTFLDDASMNWVYSPHFETLYLEAQGTGDVALHGVRIIYMPF
jgi:hypothetical protein